MKQKSTHGAATYVRELDRLVEPGETVEHPVLIGGFVEIDRPKSSTESSVAKKRSGTAAPRRNTTSKE